MTAVNVSHEVLLWTYDTDAGSALAGKIQARCVCGWATPIKPATPAIHAALDREGARHCAPAPAERAA